MFWISHGYYLRKTEIFIHAISMYLKSGSSSKSHSGKFSFPLLFVKSKGFWFLAVQEVFVCCFHLDDKSPFSMWSESNEERKAHSTSWLKELQPVVSFDQEVLAGDLRIHHNNNTPGWTEKPLILIQSLDFSWHLLHRYKNRFWKQTRYESQYCRLLASVNYVTPVWLSFLTYKTGIIIFTL